MTSYTHSDTHDIITHTQTHMTSYTHSDTHDIIHTHTQTHTDMTYTHSDTHDIIHTLRHT